MTFGLPRHWVERFARGKTLWRRLPAEFGRAAIKVSPEARLQLLRPGAAAYDPMLLRLARDHVRDDTVVWDIGANVGVFSFAAASRAKAGYVLSVEPDPALHALLDESRRHPTNQNLRLDTICAAIADQPGTAKLAIANRGRASNFLEAFGGRGESGGIREIQLVPVLTLDLLVREIRAPTLIKVDVEGAEWAVLQGAHEVLTKTRPVIAIEVGESTREDVCKLLESLNYKLNDLESGYAWDQSRPRSNNIIAFPR